MVHVITQIFATSIVVGDIGFFLICRNKKTIILASLFSAPIGWILEIISIRLRFFSYSIRVLPIFGLPFPIFLGWFFVMLYGSIVISRLYELVNQKEAPLTKKQKCKIFIETAGIYTFPVSWGPALISIVYYVNFSLQNNQDVLNSYTWNVSDIFGLPFFSYILWQIALVYGVLICLLSFEKLKNKKLKKLDKFILITLCALMITPLGWGIEFYGVNSHSPIWSYNSNNPLMLFGPYNIPYLIYFGWFCIIFICMYYTISKFYGNKDIKQLS